MRGGTSTDSPTIKVRVAPLFRRLSGGRPRPPQRGQDAGATFLSCSFFYNANVKTWDVIVVGGGIIGLSLARELRRRL
jgi:NADPH-dependent 2,4-dienoyl-CoA reductase/sulfur reductase-like enzyme